MKYIWHNETLGERRALSHRSGYGVQEVQGFSLPDKDHLRARGPQQHGSTYLATYYRPRECSLVLMLRGHSETDFQAKHRALARALNPLDDGYLEVVTEDELRYTLVCRPSTAISMRRLNAIAAEVLIQFVADDPFFHTPEQMETLGSIIGSGLTIPFEIPAIITSPGVSASGTITNGGHVPVWPTVYITTSIHGPVVNPQIINDTTGENLTISETFGWSSYLVVDMGERTAFVYPTGTNVLGSVSGTWWDLEVGDNDVRVIHDGPDHMGVGFYFQESYLAVV